MKKHALKGNCSPKPKQPASHPWRRKLFPWAKGYKVDAVRFLVKDETP